MGRIIVKTFEEIDKEWPPEKVSETVRNARSFPDDITDEDRAAGRVRPVRPGEGFAAYQERIDETVSNFA